MDPILDKTKTVDLTIHECVLLRNALRGYISMMFEYVKDDLDGCKYVGAVCHEKVISDAITVFGKLT